MVPLRRLAWARSGDKADVCNIDIVARKPDYLPYIAAAMDQAAVAGNTPSFSAIAARSSATICRAAMRSIFARVARSTAAHGQPLSRLVRQKCCAGRAGHSIPVPRRCSPDSAGVTLVHRAGLAYRELKPQIGALLQVEKVALLGGSMCPRSASYWKSARPGLPARAVLPRRNRSPSPVRSANMLRHADGTATAITIDPAAGSSRNIRRLRSSGISTAISTRCRSWARCSAASFRHRAAAIPNSATPTPPMRRCPKSANRRSKVCAQSMPWPRPAQHRAGTELCHLSELAGFRHSTLPLVWTIVPTANR